MSSENLDFVELSNPDECSTPNLDTSSNNENNVEPNDQQAKNEPVFILEAKDRDSIVGALTRSLSIWQGDEIISKKAGAPTVDRLLTVLSDLEFKNDTNSRPAIDKASQSRLVFDLTKTERMRIVNQLFNIKTYAIINAKSTSNETKNALILENQHLINLLLSGLPFKKVQCSTPASASNSPVPTQPDWSMARSKAIFTWKVTNVGKLFSGNAPNYSQSTSFYCQFMPFSLVVETKQLNGETFLAVLLMCQYKNSGDLPFRCKTSFELRLLSAIPGGVKDKIARYNYEFDKAEGIGSSGLVSYKELMNASNGYVREDAFLVQVQLEAEPVRQG